jgi:hypothetical protein
MVIGYDEIEELYFIRGQQIHGSKEEIICYLKPWQVSSIIETGISCMRRRKDFQEYILELK